ncbi:hypothetical protein ACFX13_003664 [Malus domestica]|uniref:6-phosphogluconate dehydrogenase NADP-binding domain-containing protein n=1 Tax=Malus domestica TaxID=3750 RepID=A0A498IX13_MALDO|nr:hypothetical protein DVH24_034640 [Malus domestica]
MEASATLSHIGLAGLTVMGQNLALNIAEKGFPISVYNPRDFVLSIERPRSVIILVKVGGEGGRGGRRTQRTPSACTDVAHQPYVTQPSGSWAGNPCRACPSSSHTLEPHPPVVGPFLLACPPSN